MGFYYFDNYIKAIYHLCVYIYLYNGIIGFCHSNLNLLKSSFRHLMNRYLGWLEILLLEIISPCGVTLGRVWSFSIFSCINVKLFPFFGCVLFSFDFSSSYLESSFIFRYISFSAFLTSFQLSDAFQLSSIESLLVIVFHDLSLAEVLES